MRPDVVFTVTLIKDGRPLASPTVLGEFGQEVRIEIPDVMRALVLATAPDSEGRSFTSAKMAVFQAGDWQPPKEMAMQAHLSMTPSFEYTVPNTPYRFVIMPRGIVSVSPDGQYLAVSETISTTTWRFR